MTLANGRAEARKPRCRILHLEDSAIDAELVTAHLTRSGLDVSISLVATRDAYVNELVAGDLDLVLADYVVPGFDGLSALELKQELAPDLPFIFVSGTLGEEAAVDAVKRGATDYVVKQRLARLPIVVERAMAEAQMRASKRRALGALRESEARLRLALEAGRLGAWELDVKDRVLRASSTCLAIFGRPPGSDFTYDDLCAAVHPDDQERIQSSVARAIAERVDYDIEYRAVWPDGSIHWVQLRGRLIEGAEGEPLRMAGVSLDITERKQVEERQALLSREVDHRARNALAVVLAALRLTKADDLHAYVRAVEGRVAALARAQTLLSEDRWTGADLQTLVLGELTPFLAGDPGRAALSGPSVLLPAEAAQPLAMAVHELATNAVKYGALSVAEGRIAIAWEVLRKPVGQAALWLRWAECGGPPVLKTPERRGFGRRVLDGTVRGQLGGRLLLSWAPDGLACEIEVPLEAPKEEHRRFVGFPMDAADLAERPSAAR